MRDAHDIKLGSRSFRIHYSRPSFLEGMARIPDIGGTMEPRVEILSDRRDTGKNAAETLERNNPWHAEPDDDSRLKF